MKNMTKIILIAVIGSGMTLFAGASEECDPYAQDCNLVLNTDADKLVNVPEIEESAYSERRWLIPDLIPVTEAQLTLPKGKKAPDNYVPRFAPPADPARDNFNNIQIDDIGLWHFVTLVANSRRGSFLNVNYIGSSPDSEKYRFQIDYDTGDYYFPGFYIDQETLLSDSNGRGISAEGRTAALTQSVTDSYDALQRISIDIETTYREKVASDGSISYNDNYLSYGLWIAESDYVYRGISYTDYESMGAFVDGPADKYQNTRFLTGIAKYEGRAIGAINNTKVYGDVYLTADFDAETISGIIDGTDEDAPLHIILENAEMRNGAFIGNMRARLQPYNQLHVMDGVWGGQFYGKDNPDHVAGTLGSSIIGYDLVMVYGADIKEVDEALGFKIP